MPRATARRRCWRPGEDADGHGLALRTSRQDAVAREAVRRGADWVFPRDGEESQPFASRDALCALLDGAGPLQAWRWRDLWPGPDAAFGSCRLDGRYETAASQLRTVVLAREHITGDRRLVIGAGGHGARPLPAGLTAKERLGSLLQAPVRGAGRAAAEDRGEPRGACGSSGPTGRTRRRLRACRNPHGRAHRDGSRAASSPRAWRSADRRRR